MVEMTLFSLWNFTCRHFKLTFQQTQTKNQFEILPKIIAWSICKKEQHGDQSNFEISKYGQDDVIFTLKHYRKTI